jgi:hypothetical protein
VPAAPPLGLREEKEEREQSIYLGERTSKAKKLKIQCTKLRFFKLLEETL